MSFLSSTSENQLEEKESEENEIFSLETISSLNISELVEEMKYKSSKNVLEEIKYNQKVIQLCEETYNLSTIRKKSFKRDEKTSK